MDQLITSTKRTHKPTKKVRRKERLGERTCLTYFQKSVLSSHTAETSWWILTSDWWLKICYIMRQAFRGTHFGQLHLVINFT